MVDLSSSLCKRLPEGKPPFSYGFPMVFPLKTSQKLPRASPLSCRLRPVRPLHFGCGTTRRHGDDPMAEARRVSRSTAPVVGGKRCRNFYSNSFGNFHGILMVSLFQMHMIQKLILDFGEEWRFGKNTHKY